MKRILLTSLLLLSTAVGAQAADLLVQDEAPATSAPSSLSGYVQVMGGGTLPNSLYWDEYAYDNSDGDYDLFAGWIAGATVGFELPVDGLSLEMDVLHSSAQYDPASSERDDDYLNSTSLMANLVYTADLSDVISVYGGVGVGAIWLNYEYLSDTTLNESGVGAGYQVFGGVQMSVADNISLTLETRYQSTFENVVLDLDNSYEFNRTSILGGVLFSF